MGFVAGAGWEGFVAGAGWDGFVGIGPLVANGTPFAGLRPGGLFGLCGEGGGLGCCGLPPNST